MSKVTELLGAVQDEYEREIDTLRLALAIVVQIPKIMENMPEPTTEEAKKFAFQQSECLRIAKLYGKTDALNISCEDAIALLQEGLA